MGHQADFVGKYQYESDAEDIEDIKQGVSSSTLLEFVTWLQFPGTHLI